MDIPARERLLSVEIFLPPIILTEKMVYLSLVSIPSVRWLKIGKDVGSKVRLLKTRAQFKASLA